MARITALTVFAALLTYSLAQITGDVTNNNCPQGVGSSDFNGYSFCCPGIVNGGGGVPSCLIGCQLVFPNCFPQCSDGSNEPSTSGTCTTVPVTASDYSSRVFGAAASESTAAATLTASQSAGAVTGSGQTQTEDSDDTSTATSGGAQQTTASTSTSHGAAPVITAGPMLGLGVLAGALLL